MPPSRSYVVSFDLEDWDERRDFKVVATNVGEAVELARKEHPWESEHAVSIFAWEDE